MRQRSGHAWRARCGYGAACALACVAMPALGQNNSAEATYETVTLEAGFNPDPHSVELSSGGGISASDLGSGCVGYIANAPDVRLHYTAGDDFPLIIYAESSEDITLVVNAPDGNWYCDDDSGGAEDPEIYFDDPQSGRYEIWVGTYGDSTLHKSTLYISELDF